MIPQAGSIRVQGHLAVRLGVERDFRSLLLARKEKEEGMRQRRTGEKKKREKQYGKKERKGTGCGWKCHRSNRSLHKLNEESGRRLGGTQHLKMLTRELKITGEGTRERLTGTF